uniref:Uncharacterized protein n=1 Tax=Oryza sativa subsp. japonica TaxID=39947 RepID=Q654R8_ORYSJ|nr:unknown protein [Oryza sativa Japonica Group]BAD52607.1 unknown protein [Oryza sativa Japonica Group]
MNNLNGKRFLKSSFGFGPKVSPSLSLSLSSACACSAQAGPVPQALLYPPPPSPSSLVAVRRRACAVRSSPVMTSSPTSSMSFPVDRAGYGCSGWLGLCSMGVLFSVD